MSLPEETLQRLARLGFTSEGQLRLWQDMLDRGEETLLANCLRKYEEAAAEYTRAFPLLQAYAADCRRATPIRPIENFSPKEREQHRILLAKMREFAAGEGQRLLSLPNTAIILYTTPVGLTAATEVFCQTSAVLLLEEERERWFSEIYHRDEDAFWWYIFAWWTIREELPPEDAEMIRRNYPLPDGSAHWIVTDGTLHGSLSGGADHEIWRWNGERAELLEVYAIDTF